MSSPHKTVQLGMMGIESKGLPNQREKVSRISRGWPFCLYLMVFVMLNKLVVLEDCGLNPKLYTIK